VKRKIDSTGLKIVRGGGKKKETKGVPLSEHGGKIPPKIHRRELQWEMRPRDFIDFHSTSGIAPSPAQYHMEGGLMRIPRCLTKPQQLQNSSLLTFRRSTFPGGGNKKNHDNRRRRFHLVMGRKERGGKKKKHSECPMIASMLRSIQGRKQTRGLRKKLLQTWLVAQVQFPTAEIESSLRDHLSLLASPTTDCR
jgi:hypothetical protein